MLRPEFEDHADRAELQELIEQFESYFQSQSYGYLDEDALERLYEFYESRMEVAKLEAVAELAISQNPFSGEFLTRKAELLFNRGAMDDALALLEKALVFDSSNVDVHILKSDILLELNQSKQAAEVLLSALETADDQDKDVILAELSDIYELKEDFEKAFDCLEQAIRYNPQNDAVLMKLAHIVEMTDKYDESLKLHNQIVDEHPYNWMAWYNLGKAYSGSGQYQKALDSYEFTIAIQEDFDLVYRDAADIYFRLELYDKAISSFNEAQSKSGGFEDHNFRIGLCHEKLQDYKKARFHYRKATRQDPYMDEAFFRIAETYKLEGRYEPAIVNYKKALRIDHENEFYITCLIGLYRMTGREEEVGQHLQQLVTLRPEINNYWLDYITYSYECEAFNDALDLVEIALERCGKFAEFIYLQSLLNWKLGKTREALNLLANALEDDYIQHRIIHEIDPDFFTVQSHQELLEMYR